MEKSDAIGREKNEKAHYLFSSLWNELLCTYYPTNPSKAETPTLREQLSADWADCESRSGELPNVARSHPSQVQPTWKR